MNINVLLNSVQENSMYSGSLSPASDTSTISTTEAGEVLDLLFEEDGVLDWIPSKHELSSGFPNLSLGEDDFDQLDCVSCIDMAELIETPLNDHPYSRAPSGSVSSSSSMDGCLTGSVCSSNSATAADSCSSDSGSISPPHMMGCDASLETLDASHLMEDHTDLLTAVISESSLNFDFETDVDFALPGEDNLWSPKSLFDTDKSEDLLPFTIKDSKDSLRPQSSHDNQLGLSLSDEEKTLLKKEGFAIPTHMPLTKEEERMLKTVRRKIRNKVSAKESRRKKQDYVDGLEKRVKMCTMQNHHLQKKMCSLEKQNLSLVEQLRKLQSIVAGSSRKPVQMGTGVMVMLFSFALLVLPNLSSILDSSDSLQNHSYDNNQPSPGRSRALLSLSGPAIGQDPPIIMNNLDKVVKGFESGEVSSERVFPSEGVSDSNNITKDGQNSSGDIHVGVSDGFSFDDVSTGHTAEKPSFTMKHETIKEFAEKVPQFPLPSLQVVLPQIDVQTAGSGGKFPEVRKVVADL